MPPRAEAPPPEYETIDVPPPPPPPRYDAATAAALLSLPLATSRRRRGAPTDRNRRSEAEDCALMCAVAGTIAIYGTIAVMFVYWVLELALGDKA